MKKKILSYFFILVLALSASAYTNARAKRDTLYWYVPYGTQQCNFYLVPDPFSCRDFGSVLCTYIIDSEPIGAPPAVLYPDDFCFSPLFRWD